MKYAIATLLVLAGLQAIRGEFLAVLCFLIIATGAHVAWTGYRRS